MEQRIKELYDLISTSQNTLTQKDICVALSQWYKYDDDEHTHDHCSTIWRDINEINKSKEFERIIIIENNTYRLGTKDECLKYADKMMVKALKALTRYWALVHKINSNGQGNVFDTEKFVRSFLDDNR